jgi:hypothetical protein
MGPDRRLVLTGGGLALAGASLWPVAAFAASRSELYRDAYAALQRLYATNEKARQLGRKARGILVFPSITKAGFMVGGQGGKGVLFVNGQTAGYYTPAHSACRSGRRSSAMPCSSSPNPRSTICRRARAGRSARALASWSSTRARPRP